MIVGEQKPLAEIKKLVTPYGKVLVLGCGTCVKTCFAGGEDETAVLASALRLAFKMDKKDIVVEELTVERQCEDAFVQEAAKAIGQNCVCAVTGMRCRCSDDRTPVWQNTCVAGCQHDLYWCSRASRSIYGRVLGLWRL